MGQTGFSARGDDHLVVPLGGPREGDIALRADHVGRVEGVGVDEVGLSGRKQLGLLVRADGRQQMQSDAGTPLQRGVEHVPAGEAFGRKVRGDQEI